VHSCALPSRWGKPRVVVVSFEERQPRFPKKRVFCCGKLKFYLRFAWEIIYLNVVWEIIYKLACFTGKSSVNVVSSGRFDHHSDRSLVLLVGVTY
jgi:hypothetical protein